jgi:hypothetical protein
MSNTGSGDGAPRPIIIPGDSDQLIPVDMADLLPDPDPMSPPPNTPPDDGVVMPPVLAPPGQQPPADPPPPPGPVPAPSPVQGGRDQLREPGPPAQQLVDRDLALPPTKVDGVGPPEPWPLIGPHDLDENREEKGKWNYFGALLAAALLVLGVGIGFWLVAGNGGKKPAAKPLAPPADTTVPRPVNTIPAPRRRATPTTPTTVALNVIPATPGGGALLVIVPTNFMSFTGDPCHGGGLLHLSVALGNIAPNTSVKMAFTGPGLPPTLTFTQSPGQTFATAFPVSGAGQWSDDIVSVGGKSLPGGQAGVHEGTSWQC